MKKLVNKLILLTIAVIILLTSCAKKNDTGDSSDDTRQGTSANGETLKMQNESEDSYGSAAGSGILEIVDYESCMTEEGFYYLKNIDTDTDDYMLIMHLNISSMLEIPLCNKPNCKHTDDSCNAYVKSVTETYLFTNKDKLYLVIADSDRVNDIYSGNPEASTGFTVIGVGSAPQTIYRMNLDGTNRTKLMELDSKIKIQLPFVIDGNNLYCKKYETKQQSTGDNKITEVNENEELICINLDNQTVIKINDMKNKNIIGIHQTKIILQGYDSDIDYASLPQTDAAFIEYYNNTDRSIITYDVNTKEEKTHIKAKTTKLDNVVQKDNRVCYYDREGNKVKLLNLDTGEIADLPINMIKSRSFLSEIVDDKLIYNVSEDKQVNAMVDNSYCYDFKTGENKELTLFIESNEKFPVNILGDAGGSYLVIPKQDEVGEKTWAGTMQYNVIKQYYALIEKSDFWSGKADYSYFEEE